MLDYVWFIMLLVSLIYSIIAGSVDTLSASLISGTDSSIQLIITISGMLCFWSGILEVANKSNINHYIGKLMTPILKLLLRNVPKSSKASELISLNISANLLGLGNAATPLGLNAMEELSKLNDNPLKASDDMILFVVMNTASIQLIPTTLITYRTAYGSASPFEIMPCIWISSAAALLVGILFAKTLSKSCRSL